MKNHNLPEERLLRYWQSLLSVKPTGNVMVDAGFHEELRGALRDALHCLEDLSISCRSATLLHGAARPANVDFGR